MTSQIRVEPAGIVLDVHEGETVMHAAERLGYRWPTICHGQAQCAACVIVVESGGEHFPPPRDEELAGLELNPSKTLFVGRELRLACQARPSGDAVVTKRGVRPAD
jgi:2Fe-2S ferredoxin